MNSYFWLFLERYVYSIPEPSPRVRTKPMQVLCVGPPRSATESLQHALLILGYDHTYHGWDILFEEPLRIPGWVRLARKKWFGSHDGDCHISATEFDALLGHSVAVTDAASSCFAAEMIQAYPDAKVVLNFRRDLNAWHKSAVKNIVGVSKDWTFWFLSWSCKEMFWMWHVYERLLWPGLFRSPDGKLVSGITVNGKWVYREHCNMIRGLVPKEKLLEWSIEDGWEPLCKFLGKDVPSDPFPNTNDAAGFHGRADRLLKQYAMTAFRNMAVASGIAIAAGVVGWMMLRC